MNEFAGLEKKQAENQPFLGGFSPTTVEDGIMEWLDSL
jgi:hypothetical protein